MRVTNPFPALRAPFQKFTLYESQKAFYLVGSDKNKQCYKLLTVYRTVGDRLSVREDPAGYTRPQMQRRLIDIEVCVPPTCMMPFLFNSFVLHSISQESQRDGIRLVTKAYGIVGFVKFLV